MNSKVPDPGDGREWVHQVRGPQKRCPGTVSHSRDIPERRNSWRGVVRSLALEMEQNGFTKSEVLKRDVQIQYSQQRNTREKE
jgi:hypothetical protein